MNILITKRGLALVLGALIVVGALWYWSSPRWTLYEMRSAAEAKDSEKLSKYIDFPSVRDSLKASIRAKASAELLKAKNDGNSFGALGAAFGMSMIDGLVDAMVTPETMQAAFDARSSDSVKAPSGFKIGKDTKIDRDGLNQFRLHDDAKGGDLIFVRHGFGWELAGVAMPADNGNAPAADCPAVGACSN